MNILILANNDIGLYNFRKELLTELIHLGHKVFISLPNGDKIEPLVNLGCMFLDTPVDRRGINPVTDLKLLLVYLKLIRQVKPDYVITYTIKPNVYGGLACRMKKTPSIATITGLGTAFQGEGLLRKLITLLYKTSLKKAKAVLFENKGNRGVFIDNQIIKEPQAILLSGAGVNLTEFGYSPVNENSTTRFLFMGRIMKEKGIDELFYAAEKLKQEFSNVEFDVLGFFEDDYKGIVDNLTEKGIINFHGFQSDVKKYIEKSNCVVLPSYHEGMSNTLLEAASMGRPLIASNINGCKEAIVDGENGFLCNVGNQEDLFNKMREFVKLPYEEKVEMGRKSRLHMEKNFDRAEVVKKVISLLD